MTYICIIQAVFIIFLLVRSKTRYYFDDPWDDMGFWMDRMLAQKKYIAEIEASPRPPWRKKQILRSAHGVLGRIMSRIYELQEI